MKNNIDLKVDKMKKKTMVIIINVVLYIIFSILFTSKGFALMLAKETSKAHIVHNKYGKSYSYLEFNAISQILYRIGAVGVCITGLVVLISLTYITYKGIVEQRISVISKDTIANVGENKKVKYIIDTKYKILGNVDVNAKVSREDFFQMNAYIDKYDSKKAILLYPQEINKYRNKYSFVKDGENKILVCTVN